MPILLELLILFFITLIAYQLLSCEREREGFQEGMDEYKDYNTSDPNNAMILAQQNAGNIAVLKKQMDEIMGFKDTIVDICGNIVSLNDQMNAIVQAQADSVQQVNGGQPIAVSGTT